MAGLTAPAAADRPARRRRTVVCTARGWDGDWRGAVVIVTHEGPRAHPADLTACLHRHQLPRTAQACAVRLAHTAEVVRAIRRELLRP